MATYTTAGDNYTPGETNARAAVLPLLTALNPNTAPRAGGPVALQCQGAGFTPDAVVTFKGVDKKTKYVSAGEVTLTGDLAAADQAGAFAVTVRTPGGVSNALTFTVT